MTYWIKCLIMTYHVIPYGEKDMHTDSLQCPCNVYIENYNGDLFVYHYPKAAPKDVPKNEILDLLDCFTN